MSDITHKNTHSLMTERRRMYDAIDEIFSILQQFPYGEKKLIIEKTKRFIDFQFKLKLNGDHDGSN